MADRKGLYLLAGFDNPNIGEITADSVPDLDEWFWDSYWDCQQWIDWHKLNVQKYGKSTANQKLLTEINKRSAFGHELTCINTPYFSEYFLSQGIDFNSLVGANDPITKTGNTVVNEASEIIENTAKGAGSLSKVVKYAAPVVGVLLLTGLAYYGYKNYLK